MPRIVVLASGSGTTLQAILDDPMLRGHVVAVGSDRPDIGALERAERADVERFVVPFAEHLDRHEWNRAMEKALAERSPDLVVLAGFMRILDPGVVGRFSLVNTHPSLLPAYPGVGIRVMREMLAAGEKVAGATVHRVDEGVDTGEILAQVAVPVMADDDEHTLFARIQAAEKPLYVQTLRALCADPSPSSSQQENVTS